MGSFDDNDVLQGVAHSYTLPDNTGRVDLIGDWNGWKSDIRYSEYIRFVRKYMPRKDEVAYLGQFHANTLVTVSVQYPDSDTVILGEVDPNLPWSSIDFWEFLEAGSQAILKGQFVS